MQIEDVENQVALVRARAATWEQSKAALALAQAEFDRAKRLRGSNVVSAEEFDQKREALDAAQAQVTQALATLGLPGKLPEGTSLVEVPADFDQPSPSPCAGEPKDLQSVAHRSRRRGATFMEVLVSIVTPPADDSECCCRSANINAPAKGPLAASQRKSMRILFDQGIPA